MNNWLSLIERQQIDLFNQTSNLTGLPPFAIEKDAWVTLVLRIIFRSELRPHIVFKGGTSLSKAYKLIERFSEDIDLALNRDYLGCGGEVSTRLIKNIRRKSHDFSANVLPQIIKNELTKFGLDEKHYQITVPNVEITTQDPEIIHINYKSVFKNKNYLTSRVLIELGARFLSEPYEEKIVMSMIDANHSAKSFAEEPFHVKTVLPEKTLLEKMILLHEEFSKPAENVRYHRMSRHLYDIMQIMKTDYGKKALENNALFENIISHRLQFSPIKSVNYQNLTIRNLQYIPSGEFFELYKEDYKQMQTNMIYGESPKFEELIEELKNTTNK